MMNPKMFLLLLLMSLHVYCVAGCDDDFSWIPDNYSTVEPPSHPTIINTMIRVKQVSQVDDIGQYWAVDISLEMNWTDTHLFKDFPENEAKRLKICALNHIWKPDPYFYYNHFSEIIVTHEANMFVRLYPQFKRVHWWVMFRLNLDCLMDFTRFPLDTQDCPMWVGSTADYHDKQLYITDEQELLNDNRDLNKKLLQYDLSVSALPPEEKTYNLYSVTGFRMIMKRRIIPYIVNWYMPSGILVVISWISFCIPVEMIPGRMALLVTIFLMLVNISNNSQAHNPKAETMTALDIWLVVCMLFVAVALFQYAALLNIRYSLSEVKPRNVKSQDFKVETLSQRCRKMDRRAAVILALTFFVVNVVYWLVLLV